MKTKKYIVVFALVLICSSVLYAYNIIPKVELGQYIGLSYEYNEIIVTEEDIESEIDWELGPYAEKYITEKPIEYGDVVVLSLEFDGHEGESSEVIEYVLDGSNQEIDTRLLGKQQQDNIKIPVDDMMEQGTDEILADILYAYKEVYPELTDCFVQNEMGHKNVESYKSYISKKVYELKREMQETQDKQILLDMVVDNSIFYNIDEEYLKTLQELHTSYDSYASLTGQTRDDLLQSLGMTEEDLEANALKFTKETLVVKKILKQEKISLSSNEFNDIALNYALDLGYSNIEDFEQDCGKDYLNEVVEKEKVKSYILEKTSHN